MLEAMVSRVRCVTKLLLIVILFGFADVRAQTYHFADRPSERLDTEKADGSRSTILMDHRFTAPEQLGPQCEPAGSEVKAPHLMANECGAPASPAEIPTARARTHKPGLQARLAECPLRSESD